MKDFACKTPCDSCPFRSDIPPFLRRDRAREIVQALLSGMPFHCHKTLDYDTDADDGEPEVVEASRHCAGALILLHRETGSVFVNVQARIAANFGKWPVKWFLEANKSAPIYTTVRAFVEAQGIR